MALSATSRRPALTAAAVREGLKNRSCTACVTLQRSGNTQGIRMATTLTSKGQVTIPKRIRDELQLLPGAPVQFSVNTAGEVVLQRSIRAKGQRRAQPDRFEAVRGRADVRWRTDDLMKLLRSDD